MKIGIATCLTIPEEDVDEAITLEAFRRRGHEVDLFAWEDASRCAGEFEAVIVRSTWNYPTMPDRFADWIRDSDNKTRLLNPADIMLENLNKRYLQELGARGLPVVPSKRIWPSEASRLVDLITARSVIKPMIGAGSMDTRVFEASQLEDAIAWLESHETHREFMVQPYLPSVNSVGEQSIVMIGNEPSHRILKHPRFVDQEENVEGPFEVDEDLADLARRAVEPIHDRILYARVDMMMADSGQWMISELELIEPSLFFRQKPEALDRFVLRAEQLFGH